MPSGESRREVRERSEIDFSAAEWTLRRVGSGEYEPVLAEAYAEYRPLVLPHVWEHLERQIASGQRLEALVGAAPDGTLGGAAILAVSAFEPGALDIRAFGVRPACRGVGLGRALVLRCLVAAAEARARAVFVRLMPVMVHARSLVERLGFAVDPRADLDMAGLYAADGVGPLDRRWDMPATELVAVGYRRQP